MSKGILKWNTTETRDPTVFRIKNIIPLKKGKRELAQATCECSTFTTYPQSKDKKNHK